MIDHSQLSLQKIGREWLAEVLESELEPSYENLKGLIVSVDEWLGCMRN